MIIEDFLPFAEQAVVLLFVAIVNCQETQRENEVEERKDKRNIKLSYGAGLLGNGASYDNFNNFASPINRNLGRGYIPINEHGGE